MKCRFCKNELSNVFIDLGNSPPSNSFLSLSQLNEPESYYPLKIFVCDKCFLVQIDEYKKATEIFDKNYAYFSSYSTSWLNHAKKYTELMISRFGLNNKSLVVEIASNDGYLLQYFKERNIPILGVEPTANTAKIAIDKGINTIIDFFGSRFAEENLKNKADLILGNNVLAHVPDINDFVKGIKIALKSTGVNTFEFPHLCKLIEKNQFDTIYHEHFSYLSLTSVKSIFEKQGLTIFDIEELPTHGGSLRIYTKHTEDYSKSISINVAKLLDYEEKIGVKKLIYYNNFQIKVDKIKMDFLQFLYTAKKENKKVIGYGAAAKGNTLLNYCGIKGTDLIEFVVDASPFKQGLFLPGSKIPIVDESQIFAYKPDFIVILPWNIKEEITKQLSYIREWGGKFVITIPDLLV
ncbi:MAG: SAM-dependent methyltransferase, partial [Bacteroidetes bacterium CG_4_10_14_3_um_filter_31_20]